MELVPINPEFMSVLKTPRALLIVERSESRLLSLACFRSSEGFRVRITTTERIATIAKTMRSSINVNDCLDFSIGLLATLPAGRQGWRGR